MDLCEKLLDYSKSDIYPMHMPGHKRNRDFFTEINPVSIDITEIDGFDNLHNATGIIKAENDRIQKLFSSQKSIISVNGSTSGLVSSIYAATNDGDTIIMARNCHMAVYHSVLLRKLRVEYIYPEIDEATGICGCVTIEQVKAAVDNCPEAKLIILTSPTYEGVVSDIKRIADIAHKSNMLLLVDEAHGAHFAFCKAFPKSAVTLGADIVVQSLHKTLPCFTSAAVIHINELSLYKKIQSAMSIFETSSPSYIIMASISRCIAKLEADGEKLFDEYIKRLDDFELFSKKLRKLKVLCFGNDSVLLHKDIFSFDKSKIVVSTQSADISGKELYDLLLNKYKLQCEMCSAQYVICMTSIADTDEGFKRLKTALYEIDNAVAFGSDKRRTFLMPHCEAAYSVWAAQEIKKAESQIKNGEICGDFVFAYPPGVPVIVPGERIDDNVIKAFSYFKDNGIKLYDSCGDISEKLTVLDIDNV